MRHEKYYYLCSSSSSMNPQSKHIHIYQAYSRIETATKNHVRSVTQASFEEKYIHNQKSKNCRLQYYFTTNARKERRSEFKETFSIILSFQVRKRKRRGDEKPRSICHTSIFSIYERKQVCLTRILKKFLGVLSPNV